MKLVSRIGDFRVYALEEKECKTFHKPYPCYVCWLEPVGTINRNIGGLHTTENESDTLDEMIEWCIQNSY